MGTLLGTIVIVLVAWTEFFYRQLPAVTGRYRQLPAVTGSYRQVPAVTGSYRQLPAVTGRYRQLPAGTGSYRQVYPIARSWRKVLRFPIKTLRKIVSCVCVCFVCCAREHNYHNY